MSEPTNPNASVPSPRVDITIYWKRDGVRPTTKNDVTIAESMVALTVFDSPTEFSRIPLASILYYDVEEL